MTTKDSPEEDDLLEGIYQRLTPSLTDEVEKSFKPWHKPRKHYLRVKQWCNLIQKLIGELKYKRGDVISYLGLPGEDFLDVRTLHGVCERAEVALRYLGFDAAADASGVYELNLSKHEISSLGFVDPFSRLVRDRIERVAAAQSAAHSIVQQMGPFDVINLDLCDSVAAGSGVGSYFDLLQGLCNYQILAGRVKPWLMFLTTRAIRSQLDEGAKGKLLGCIEQNIKQSEIFASLLHRDLALDTTSLRGEIDGAHTLDHTRLVKALGLGLCKWLLGLTMSAWPKVVVRLLSVYSYRIEMAEPDMLSLAIEFRPIIEPRVDAAGLAPSRLPQVKVRTEPDLATDLIAAIARTADVDRILEGDTGLMDTMIDKCGKILEMARYDKQEYERWARSVPTFGLATHSDRGVVMDQVE